MPDVIERPMIKPWDAADYLDTPEAQAEFMNAAMEDDEGDGQDIVRALTVVTRAYALAAPADAAGLNHASLSQRLSEAGSPSLTVVAKILREMGLELTVRPIEPPPVADA